MKAIDICKKYGDKTVLHNVNAVFEDGRCTVLMGKSGAGKTSLLRILAGLESPDSGTVENRFKGKISFVFQENRLIEGKSVLENILCVAPDRERAELYLEKVGLLTDKNKKAGELSGGMKRRLSLARALAYGGEVFYMDEPLRELDSGTEHEMIELLKEELPGKSAILIVHDEEQARLLGDIIVNI